MMIARMDTTQQNALVAVHGRDLVRIVRVRCAAGGAEAVQLALDVVPAVQAYLQEVVV